MDKEFIKRQFERMLGIVDRYIDGKMKFNDFFVRINALIKLEEILLYGDFYNEIYELCFQLEENYSVLLDREQFNEENFLIKNRETLIKIKNLISNKYNNIK